MAKKLPDVLKQDSEESDPSSILNAEDFRKLTDKIVKDLENTKDDISQKVDYAKTLISAMLKFFKKESSDKVCSTSSESDFDGAVNNLRKSSEFRGLQKDVEFGASSKDKEHDACRKTRSFSYLLDKVGQELMKINDNTKALAASTKSAIRNYINTNLPQSKNEGNTIERKITRNKSNDFDISDDKTKVLMEKRDDGASTRKRKKNDQRSQPDKFIRENILIFEAKFKGDPKTKRANMDRMVKDIQKEIKTFQSMNELRKL